MTDADKERTEAQTEAQAAEAEGADEAAASDAPGQAEDLEAQLQAKTQEAEDYLDRLRRVQADFQNYKKRKEREQEETYTAIEDRLLGELLPLYDDLKRAFETLEQTGDQGSFVEGAERIFAKFQDLLDKKNVKPVEAEGKRFDPARHEVLLAVEHEGEPHVVLEEFERGYTRAGRLLRPSRVKVSRPPAKPAPDAEETPSEQDAEQTQEKES